MNKQTLTLPAPAKLNLMLHITGQRVDGYHTLQTLFQFLDYGDQLSFELRHDGRIELCCAMDGVPVEDNLIVRAARLLQEKSAVSLGANIELQKVLPMGAGLGGGSSNAATTLLALNQLWDLHYELDSLAELGLQLGADVPVFIHGRAAWAEGIGEQLTAVTLDEPWFVVLTPACHVATSEIFSNKRLTRDTPTITIALALKGNGINDCQAVVAGIYPEVEQALSWLDRFAAAKMTGTGSSVYARFESRDQANDVLAQLPQGLTGFVAQGVNLSPLHRRAGIKTALE